MALDDGWTIVAHQGVGHRSYDAEVRVLKRQGITILISLGVTITFITLLQLSLVGSATATPLSSAGAAPAAEGGNYGGDFRFPINEPTTLDPADYSWGDTPPWAIMSQVFEGLTKWDDDMQPMPALAVSWESSDAQHWTFNIRPGAKFHNGRQVTADDVVYSLERLATSGNDWYDYILSPLVDPVTETVVAADSETVQFSLGEPMAAFPTLLAMPFVSIVPSETVSTIVTEPVGAGPFEFESWTEGDDIVLGYFDDYYAGRPYLDSITYEFYDTDSEMYDEYELGNLDFSPVPTDTITDVVGSPNAIFINTLNFQYYGMKVDQAPFDDFRVRQALNYAVDRQDIVDNVLSEYAVVAEGPVPPGMEGYDPPVAGYTYNPTEALSLLSQAGWTDTDADHILDDGAGTDLTIELWHHTRTPVQEDVANALADDFRDIGGQGLGASVTVSSATWTDPYLSDIGDYPMYSLGWSADYPDPLNFLKPHFASDGSMNHTNYGDAQVDTWLDDAGSTLDLATRQALYENVEAQVQDDAPLINLYYQGAVYVKDSDVVGLVIPSWSLDAVQMEKVQLFFATHDVELLSVLQPKDTSAVEPIVPAAKVRNGGSSSEAGIPVRCRILQDGTTQVYSQTQTVGSLSAFSAQVVSFPAWTPPAAGNYTFEFTTLLSGDGDPSNDQETKALVVSATAYYDAYTRDNNTDGGSVCQSDWWQSPDIVVRHLDDGVRRHQDPILGQTNYVYVRVRNIGNSTISDGKVNVYWHSPSSAIICGNWGLINPSPISVGTLGPGQDVWVKTAWVPPIEGPTCLMSEFWSGDDPITRECEVPCDNNIAQRNVEVVPGGMEAQASLQAGQTTVLFEVTNVKDLPASVDLIVERGTFPSGGSIEVEFSKDLFDRWIADTGGTVDGGSVVAGFTRVSITDPDSGTVQGLPMDAREMQQVKMYLSAESGVEYALYVSEQIDDVVVGGMTYQTEIPWASHVPLVVRSFAP
jgi:ABC-type transport system substrate-binding protein